MTSHSNCNFLAISLVILTLVTMSKGAIKCIDDWKECNGATGPKGECSADSCSISLVPVESCGSFMLRTCSVDYDCYKSLNKHKKDFFNIKRVGPNSLAYDYCCTGSDYCNNMTETQLMDKLCVWMRKNLPESDLAHHEVRRLCGLDVQSIDNAIPVNVAMHSLAENKKQNAKNQLTHKASSSSNAANAGPLKCACDLNMPGRFSQCHVPPEESYLLGFTNEEDAMPHCYSNDGSCSLFLTLDMPNGVNGTADIFRGCVDRKLPVSNCDSAGMAGSFVEVEPKSSGRAPFIFEYCCNGENFCNAMTIDNTVDRMCQWLKDQVSKSSSTSSEQGKMQETTTAKLASNRRSKQNAKSTRRQLQAARRENRKYSLIMRTFCQDA